MTAIQCGDHAAFEQQMAGVPPHQRPDWPLPSFDARDWSKAFLDTYDKLPDGEGLTEEFMTAWFASALMRGYDEARSRGTVQ